MLAADRILRMDFPGGSSRGQLVRAVARVPVAYYGGSLVSWDAEGYLVAAPVGTFAGVTLAGVAGVVEVEVLRGARVWLPLDGSAVVGGWVRAVDTRAVTAGVGPCGVGRVLEIVGGWCYVDTSEVPHDARLAMERDAGSVTISADPGGEVVVPGASVSMAGVMAAADKVKLDAVDTGDLATEADLDRLEGVLFDSTVVYGPQGTLIYPDRAVYLGTVTVPTVGALRLVANRVSEGQRNRGAVESSELAALPAIPDSGGNLANLEPNQRVTLHDWVDAGDDLWVGRTATNRVVLQHSGSVGVSPYMRG